MPAVSTRNVEVICDDKFYFRQHICRTHYYHIFDLRRIRGYLPPIAKTIETALVTDRFGYCHSLFHNIILLRLSQTYNVFIIT